MNKLFAVYLGGKADGCNIELHDVVFVVGTNIEETYPLLKQKWFGNMKQFHIDSYICLEVMDGYEISLSKTPNKDQENKLYFINLGAYKENEFTEYHQSAFYVEKESSLAVTRAKSELCQGLETIHKDDVICLENINSSLDYDVDDIMELREVDNYYIHLKVSSLANSKAVSKYILLDEEQLCLK